MRETKPWPHEANHDSAPMRQETQGGISHILKRPQLGDRICTASEKS